MEQSLYSLCTDRPVNSLPIAQQRTVSSLGMLSRHHGNSAAWRHSLALRSNWLGAGVHDVTGDLYSLFRNPSVHRAVA
jgi:hypothetical protein